LLLLLLLQLVLLLRVYVCVPHTVGNVFKLLLRLWCVVLVRMPLRQKKVKNESHFRLGKLRTFFDSWKYAFLICFSVASRGTPRIL
jgi:hypothetical protein